MAASGGALVRFGTLWWDENIGNSRGMETEADHTFEADVVGYMESSVRWNNRVFGVRSIRGIYSMKACDAISNAELASSRNFCAYGCDNAGSIISTVKRYSLQFRMMPIYKYVNTAQECRKEGK